MKILNLFFLLISFHLNNQVIDLKNNFNQEIKIAKILHLENNSLNKTVRKNIGKDDLVISIGGACLAAIELSRFGLRKCAYPFDIIFSEIEGVIQAINTNFSFFLDKKYLIKKNIHNSYHLYNSYYKFTFPHDLQSLNLTLNFNSLEFKEFEEKYKRRITRFNNLDEYNGKVYFLRTFSPHITKESFMDIIILRNLIIKKFPKLNFEIIVVTPEKNDVNENNIKYLSSDSFTLFSKKTDNEFVKIFNSLSIKIKPREHLNFSELNN